MGVQFVCLFLSYDCMFIFNIWPYVYFNTLFLFQDIAFKVVNREWEYSYKRGFRCQFQNNIFQMWFHFKRYRYRRWQIYVVYFIQYCLHGCHMWWWQMWRSWKYIIFLQHDNYNNYCLFSLTSAPNILFITYSDKYNVMFMENYQINLHYSD